MATYMTKCSYLMSQAVFLTTKNTKIISQRNKGFCALCEIPLVLFVVKGGLVHHGYCHPIMIFRSDSLKNSSRYISIFC